MNGSPSLGTRGFICPYCETPTTGSIRGIAVWSGRDRDGNPETPPTEWSLVQCDTCGQPLVHWREDYGRGFEYDEAAILYPAPRRLSRSVPDDLRAAYEEAQTCFQAKAYTATAVMVRRTLEGMCQEQGIRERTLAEALKRMQTEGKMDSTLSEWANELRAVGNEGAHFTGKNVPREDAEDALAFAEAVLDHIYVLRRKFNEFKTRRAVGQEK